MANLSIENMLKIIPDFDGTPEKLHKFLTCCNIIYAPLQFMMPTTLFFIEILKSKLNGPAYEVVPKI